MMDIELLRDIVAYIGILQRDYDLQVSFHYDEPNGTEADLLKYVLHDNDYCACVKKTGLRYCNRCKKFTMRKQPQEAYIGVCYAGVMEHIIPVFHNGKIRTFISVSGYRTEWDGFRRISKKICVPENVLREEYDKLETNIPAYSDIAPLIRPLSYMLQLLYSMPVTEDSVKSRDREVFGSILEYILENYKSDIRIGDICRYCHYSERFISELFKRNSGMTLTAYITRLKLEDAAIQLKNTDQKIVDIAYSLGFNDSNYFTNKFRKYYGCSPKEYRKKTQSS